MSFKKVALVILDGWGIGENPAVDAIHHASTPYYDSLIRDYPHARLVTFGEQVGLPAGQMGNSEVGHLNIGAGRIVYQELARINKEIKEDQLRSQPAIKAMINHALSLQRPVHLMGLLSDGGVHAHIDHLIALCKIVSDAGVKRIYVHAFMDGRDTDPRGGVQYIKHLMDSVGPSVRLASMIGRYYAMDRDQRWERIKHAYDMMIHGEGIHTPNAIDALSGYYAQDITDEFIPATVLDRDGLIREGDAVLFFNFRTDRPRQLVRVLTQEAIQEYQMQPLALKMTTMVSYDDSYKDVDVVYRKDNLRHDVHKSV